MIPVAVARKRGERKKFQKKMARNSVEEKFCKILTSPWI
jgi:hypothetical protein